jgi:hypothetical protein
MPRPIQGAKLLKRFDYASDGHNAACADTRTYEDYRQPERRRVAAQNVHIAGIGAIDSGMNSH